MFDSQFDKELISPSEGISSRWREMLPPVGWVGERISLEGMEENIKNRNRMRLGKTSNHLWVFRKKRGYSQKEVATLLGHKNGSHLSEYERGEIIPSLQTAMKLAVILSTSVDVLFAQMREELRREIQARREKLLASQDE